MYPLEDVSCGRNEGAIGLVLVGGLAANSAAPVPFLERFALRPEKAFKVSGGELGWHHFDAVHESLVGTKPPCQLVQRPSPLLRGKRLEIGP